MGHDLKKLLLKIDENERNSIVQLTIKQMQETEPDFTETDFWEYLERNKEVFEDWGYFYRRGKQADIFFATDNGIVNYVYAEEIKAKLMKAVLEFDIDR